MNTRSTWILVLLALALGGYTYLTERPAGLPGAVAVRFTTFDPSQVQGIELLRSNGIVRVDRAGSGWRMSLPVVYGAQKTAVEGFLKSLSELQPRRMISASELSARGGTNSLKAFGFDAEPLTVKLEMASGSPLLYQIGGPTPLGAQFYFKQVGADGVFTGDDAFLGNLPPTPDHWRDRSLFDLRGQSFDRLEIRGPTAFTAVRESTNGSWRLVKPLAARADSERIEALINALQVTPVAAFVSDSPLVDLAAYGFQPPESEFVLGRGTNDLVHLQFGRVPTNSPEHVLVRRMATTNVVLAPVQAGMLLRLPLPNFRDRSLAPRLEGVSEVRFRSDGGWVRIERQGTNWTVVEPRRFAADPALMDQLLRQLGGMTIVEFPNDVPADLGRYGLQRPERGFVVLAGTNELARLDFGSQVGTDDKVYVRRADEPSIYATRLGELLRLPEVADQIRLMRFDPTNVVEIAIEQKGRKRVLTRGSNGRWTASSGSPAAFLDETVNETLFRLGRVESTRYRTPEDEQLGLLKFKEVDHSVDLKFRPGSGPVSLRFQFGGKNPANNMFALVRFDTDSDPLLIEFPVALYEDVYRDLSAP
ncbi:MAG: DUF4340 domain-containing protein [Limisphaerales bacterium]